MTSDVLAAGFLLAVAGLYAAAWRRLSVPVRLMSAAFWALSAFAAFGYTPSERVQTGADQVPAAALLTASPLSKALLFGLPAAAIVIGALAVGQVIRRRESTDEANGFAEIPPGWFGGILFIGWATLALKVVGQGVGELWFRQEYIQKTGPAIFVRVGTSTLPLGIALLGAVLLSRKATGPQKFIAAGGLISCVVVTYAINTRTFALIPILVWIGYMLTGRRSIRRMAISGAVAVFLSIVLLPVPLSLRAISPHGVRPDVALLVHDPSAVYSTTKSQYDNIFLGIPLSWYEGHAAGALPRGYFITDVNPLPSQLTNFPQIQANLRFTNYQPYGGIGELWNYGVIYLLLWCAAAGAVVEGATRRLQNAIPSLRVLVTLAMTGFAAILVARASQYQLRTETRLLYYLIIGVGLVSLALLLARRPVERARWVPTAAPAPAEPPDPAEPPGPAADRAPSPAAVSRPLEDAPDVTEEAPRPLKAFDYYVPTR